jgi:hypothetical protein
MQVGAIHGRLLTAWSAAGVVGPLLINFMRDYQVAHGVALAQSYNVTMYILVGFLIAGLACNLFVTPVDARHHFSGAAANERAGAPSQPAPAGRIA